MTTPRILGIVLAGGASTRFGADKLAAPVAGRPLLHHAIDAVAAVADHVIVVVAPEAPLPGVPASVIGRVSVARDPASHRGPLAGLAAGLQAGRAPTGDDPRDIALVIGGDMPSLVPAVLRLLVDALERDGRLVAVTLEATPSAPLPMALRVVAVDPAETLLRDGRRSLRSLLDTIPSATIPAAVWRALDLDARTLRDVDTPADL